MPASPEHLPALRACERLWRDDVGADVDAVFAARFTEHRPRANWGLGRQLAEQLPDRGARRLYAAALTRTSLDSLVPPGVHPPGPYQRSLKPRPCAREQVIVSSSPHRSGRISVAGGARQL